MCPAAANGPRIGLLGGTFDPPHLGHLVVAEIARVALELDQVQFVVAGQPWMKDSWSDAEHRVEMVDLATKDNDAFRVNTSEVERSGPTYTADTLEELTSRMPGVELCFLLGADAAAKLEEWYAVERALELASFVAVTRPGHRLELDGPILGQVTALETPAIEISSTDLRRRFREGEAVRYQLPEAVEHYVRAHRLYRTRCP